MKIIFHLNRQGCPLLNYLDVSWCSKITDNGIKHIATGCPKLKSLVARGLSEVSFFFIEYIFFL